MKAWNLRIHRTATLNVNSTNPSCAIQMSSFASTLAYMIRTLIRAEFTATNSKGISTVSIQVTGTILGQSAPTIATSGLSATSTVTTITLLWTSLTSGWMLQRSKLISTRCRKVSFTTKVTIKYGFWHKLIDIVLLKIVVKETFLHIVEINFDLCNIQPDVNDVQERVIVVTVLVAESPEVAIVGALWPKIVPVLGY